MSRFSLAIIVTCAVAMFCSPAVYANSESNVQFSGFARVVAGYLDDDSGRYLGYKNSVSLDKQSLLGLQLDYQFTNELGITAQVIGRTADTEDSGIEWLYLTYSPHKSLKFKLGRQRTPVFSYSDFSDVGFAYNWVTLPQQVYRQFMLPNYDGLHSQYDYVGKNISLSMEAYIGGLERDYDDFGQDINVDVDNFKGLVGTLGYNNWTFRASLHLGDIDINIAELDNFSDTLNLAGFAQSANSLSNEGKGEFYQFSAFYEDIDYFFRTELTKLNTELFYAPDTNGYFVSGGLNFYPFSVHLSFARDTSRYNEYLSEIPIGVNEQLDQLAYGYQAIVGQLHNNSTVSYTLGGRWDWQDNLAFKVEATLLKERDGYQGLFTTRKSDFDGEAMLYQLALEWVF
ncbi:hypothetical protein RS130_05805 [Paraglaciecola aquimarina]|uniref:Porin domain-containing protein n=1 Tax=Paraglaciecola aquimarina TaxID=1235557 RepID=A0ABU3SU18_9ALTE|nr:hypothetical protein [Paraglaciecola aquimarina]MDU0353506.1 hypothetical protein [Paraglaciecola aquimarina]